MTSGLSLLLVRSAGPVAQTGWRPPGAPWSCDLNAAATSAGDLLRAGACAWWLSCCSALRVPAVHAPQEHPFGVLFSSTQIGYLIHPGCPKVSIGWLGVWVIGPSHAPGGVRGGPDIGSGTVTHHILKRVFRPCGFLCHMPSSQYRPDFRNLTKPYVPYIGSATLFNAGTATKTIRRSSDFSQYLRSW